MPLADETEPLVLYLRRLMQANDLPDAVAVSAPARKQLTRPQDFACEVP